MNVKKIIYKMLVENTGKALCDSGGAYGRHWQENQKKTMKDFENEPDVKWDGEYYIISVFHYLVNGLEIDNICQMFNKKFVPAKDWESTEFYGVSAKGEAFLLNDLGMEAIRTFNSYNGDSALSQVIQGTWLKFNDKQYLLLQIHNGCDVRGGYTDARLFYCPAFEDGALTEDVHGIVTKVDGQEIRVDNIYNGYSLTDEQGQEVTINDSDKVELWLRQ